MKTKIMLLMLLSILTLKAQSILAVGSGATLDVSGGADICSDSLSGIVTGNGTFCGNPTDVESESDGITPAVFALEQNYPNPFNPSTKIKYSIPDVGTLRATSVQLKVYDVLGNEIATLVNEEKPAGSYEVEFSVAHESLRASGVYFYKLQAGAFTETRKMLLLK